MDYQRLAKFDIKVGTRRDYYWRLKRGAAALSFRMRISPSRLIAFVPCFCHRQKKPGRPSNSACQRLTATADLLLAEYRHDL